MKSFRCQASMLVFCAEKGLRILNHMDNGHLVLLCATQKPKQRKGSDTFSVTPACRTDCTFSGRRSLQTTHNSGCSAASDVYQALTTCASTKEFQIPKEALAAWAKQVTSHKSFWTSLLMAYQPFATQREISNCKLWELHFLFLISHFLNEPTSRKSQQKHTNVFWPFSIILALSPWPFVSVKSKWLHHGIQRHFMSCEAISRTQGTSDYIQGLHHRTLLEHTWWRRSRSQVSW